MDTTLTTANNYTYYSDNGLPVVSSAITIAGNGHTITRVPADPDYFRLIAVNSSGDLTVRDTTLSGGYAASDGGGIANFYGQLRLEGCMVSGNRAFDSGGGVSSLTDDTSVLSLVNTTLSGNTARFFGGGGGVFSFATDSSTVSVVNSTLSGNSASSDGGGGVSFARFGTVALRKNLIVGNTTTDSGDEVFWAKDDLSDSFLENEANLFGHNGVSTADALDGFSAGITNITATADGNDPTALADVLDTALANNGGPTLTHALVTGSPAFNAAGVCGLATDQRGVIRPQGIACDIGAFEVEAIPPSEVCGNCLDDDGDNQIDLADEDCPALPLSSEKGAFDFKSDPDEDQISMTATFPLGPVINPPNEVVVVQFFDAAGQLACVQIPTGTVVRKPPGWKVKTGRTGTTWSFSDAKDGSLGDPTKDKLNVRCNTKKEVCMVKLKVEEANIAGDATARDITTGVIIGNDAWVKEQRWQPEDGGKKLVTP